MRLVGSHIVHVVAASPAPDLRELRCSFAELSKALDPRKDVKTDKTSIVADAIRVVTQLRAENGQLKQLNKFLEVPAFCLCAQ